MDSFNGKWVGNGLVITIEETNNIITSLTYENGRGPFQGFEVNVGSPVISVDFTDGIRPAGGLLTGVLNLDGDTICWTNGGTWTRVR